MATALRMRPAVHNLTADQLTAFRSAYARMQAITDNRSFSYFAGLHGAPNWYCWHNQQNDEHFAGRRMQVFLPWHRAYLYTLELTMRDFVPEVTLPWWDWTLGPPRQSGIPDVFAADTLDDGTPNPLFSSQISLPMTRPPIDRPSAREPDDPANLPAPATVARALARTDWNDFSAAVENIHNSVHGWVGGDMGQVQTAAFDPIFFSHHTMIDRMFAIWQVRNGNGNISRDLLDFVLTPFPLKIRDVMSVNALGYDYAAAATAVVSGGQS